MTKRLHFCSKGLTTCWAYGNRSKLTNASASVDTSYRYGYSFDDIGNRRSSAERGVQSAEYTANNLNQYTNIEYSAVSPATCRLSPTYDADGNQTLVKTATGIWSVTYNGENRPMRWENGDSVITMSYDRMGRRVTKNDQRFVYNGYLQIANFRSTTTTSDYNYFIWDPTERVATRPLVWKRGTSVAYYTHDGNKNVSEVVASNNDVAAHYEYAPFGALTVSCGVSAAANPWRFSSEYAEDDTATVYYNYRHYEPVMGRWMARDPMSEHGGHCLYSFSTRMSIDVLGLKEVSISGFADTDDWSENWSIALAWRFHSVGKDIVFRSIDVLMRNIDVEVGECDCIKYFQITAHGSSSRVDEPDGTSDSVAIHMGKDLYLFEDEKEYEISGLFDGLKGKFCKRCEIVLRSCYLGQSPWLEDRIRKETGCDVKLFKWSVNPILGNDWIEKFAREAPRVPTIGMPGMLPL